MKWYNYLGFLMGAAPAVALLIFLCLEDFKALVLAIVTILSAAALLVGGFYLATLK